ncbi:MAGUK p55 subfamily member 4 [Scleropages formosus]|uniref:MAGUK p55 subfamily member 4 n=1 Tax=Scleropages formosus TaxID=113540 RepID=UPI0010FA6D4E|nr:MAGUK p55 subfamily member 4 [Scleropages formosus]XP_029112653.1 MAGUK p55 subfamily member 4 [Scleropages formosus]
MSPELHEDGLTEILASVVEEVKLSIGRDVNGADVLYSLLNAPWLQSLLKVYERLQQYMRTSPSPYLAYATGLSHQLMAGVRRAATPSPEARELYRLLRDPHLQAFLSAHDTVARKDYEPMLPPLPDSLPDDEEAVRIVCLVKNNQPLGATIKRDELTGEIFVARVIHGGLADRSGLLYAGDKLIEVNGQPVEGMEPEQVIEILAHSHGTIMFKLVPMSDRPVNSQTLLYVRAMLDYNPRQDPAIPCADAGMAFRRGDVLEIVDQTDGLWWQARKMPSLSACAGLIPSAELLRRKQRELWWSQPFQPHTCTTTLSTVDEEEDIDESFIETDPDTFESEEEEYSTNPAGIYLAGFRRSMRLSRRKSHSNHSQSCYSRCPSSCYSILANPYEEVVRHRRHPQDKPRLVALMGPSGVGVNELRRRLIAMDPNTFQGPVPHTTRPRKHHEEWGREYHFIGRELFENMVYNHRFLEYGEYRGHLYGTSINAIKSVLDSGKICVVDIEPHGIRVVRTHELRAYIIFVKPPSAARMKLTRTNARITAAGYVNRPFREEDFQEIEEEGARMESQHCHFFDHLIVNDGLQDSCVQLLAAVKRAQDEPQWVPASWLRPTDVS